MVLAVSESPRTTYEDKIAEAYLRTGPVTTKCTLGNILIALVLFLHQLFHPKYGAFLLLRKFIFVLFTSSLLSWAGSMVLFPSILAVFGLEVGQGDMCQGLEKTKAKSEEGK